MKRRPLQFGIRSILILMVVVAAFTFSFNIISNRINQLQIKARQDFVRANISALELKRQQLLINYGAKHPKIHAATMELDALKGRYEATFTPND